MRTSLSRQIFSLGFVNGKCVFMSIVFISGVFGESASGYQPRNGCLSGPLPISPGSNVGSLKEVKPTLARGALRVPFF